MRELRDGRESWLTRITIDRKVREAIRARSAEENRPMSWMIGDLLRDFVAATARSSA